MNKITKLEWGKIVVNNQTFKDCIVTNSVVKEWDWSLSKTSHGVGVTTLAIREYLNDPNIKTIILTSGVENKIRLNIITLVELVKHKYTNLYINQTDLQESIDALQLGGVRLDNLNFTIIELDEKNFMTESDGKRVFILQTNKAVNVYNRLIESGVTNIVAFVHSTC